MTFYANANLATLRDLMVRMRELHANGSPADMRTALEEFVRERDSKLNDCRLEVRGSDNKDFILATISTTAEAEMRGGLKAPMNELKQAATNMKLSVRLEDLVDTDSPEEASAVAGIDGLLPKHNTVGATVLRRARELAANLQTLVDAGYEVSADEQKILALHEPYVPTTPSWDSEEEEPPAKRARK